MKLRKTYRKYLVLILSSLIGFVKLDCPTDPDIACFAQADFDAALSNTCNQLNQVEDTLRANYDYPSFVQNNNDAGFVHFVTSDIDQAALDDYRLSSCAKDALLQLKSAQNMTFAQLLKCLKTQKISITNVCTPKPVNCNPSQTNYYRLDGQCNNQNNPLWGAESTPMIRLLPTGPDDLLSSTNTPRTDSITITKKLGINTSRPPGFNNEMTTLTLQILTHELMKTKKYQLFSEKRGGGLNCVNPTNDPMLANLISMNKNCIPISIPTGDSCYGRQVQLLNYIKSLKCFDSCQLELYPTSTNFETAYFDLKLIYNEVTLPHLDANGGIFDIDNFAKMQEIIVGYDERSMQLPGLFLFLNFFVKLHNKVFIQFKKFRPKLSTQALSLESRKVVTAVFQKIILDVVLEFVNGQDASTLADFGNCYDPSIRAGVLLEFDLTLRNCHKFIQDSSRFYQKNLFAQPSGLRGANTDPVDITVLLNNLTFYTDNICGLTHGAMDDTWNLGANGNLVTCKLFQATPNSFGHDLKAWDFQMGAEIQEPAYIDILRKFYSVNKCDDDFRKQDLIQHDSRSQDLIWNKYNGQLKSVKFSFANALEKNNGNILGRTDSLIILEQMKRSICGDRFWFTNGKVFPLANANRILNMDFFSLVCLVNKCNGTRVQTDPFISPDSGNLKKLCQTEDQILAQLDLKNWIMSK